MQRGTGFGSKSSWGLIMALIFELGGCGQHAAAPASTPPPSGGSSAADGAPDQSKPQARPADADADAAYYRARASALASGNREEIAKTDFFHFRRGRMYAEGPIAADEETLDAALTAAFAKEDAHAAADITAKILEADQADIRAHMLRAAALRKLEQVERADFHRDVAIGLIDSIVKLGDGRTYETAWTAFRVKEEYEVLKVFRCAPDHQALAERSGRAYDILDVHKIDDNQSFRLYFDITELYAEEARALSP